MKYLVFTTEQDAIAAELIIRQALGYSKPGVNALTGELDNSVLTTSWATPQQITDGRWVFPSPDETGVEAEESWWPKPVGTVPLDYVPGGDIEQRDKKV